MSKSPSKESINKFLKKQANKYPFVEFRVLRASNGEVAILPVNPETGEAQIANPRVFQVKELWNRMCAHDKIDPKSNFVAFSANNPWSNDYSEAFSKLQKGE